MLLEVRVDNKKDFDKALDLKCDKISYGVEGCYLLLPDKNELAEMIDSCTEMNKIFKLVLPKATESAMDRIVDTIRYIEQLNTRVEITVNDFGVLSVISQMNNMDIYLGHMLNYSLQACPWNENLLRDESDEIMDIVLDTNNDNKFKLGIMQDMKVKGIDCDAWKNGYDSLLRIKNYGFQVSVCYKRVSVSFSRTCPTAKYFDKPVAEAECREQCRLSKPLNINLSKLWQTDEYGQRYEDAKEGIADYFNLYVDGNWIYREDDTENRFLDSFDNVIVYINDYEELMHKYSKAIS